MMHDIELVVDGMSERVAVQPRELLGEVLRERLGRRGVHVACGEGVCGACTVLIDGAAVRSCLVLAVQADKRQVGTVAGLSGPGGLHPLLSALAEAGAVQCGYCTPGLALAVLGYLAEHPEPTDGEIRLAIAGHVCRCTGYTAIVQGIMDYVRARRA